MDGWMANGYTPEGYEFLNVQVRSIPGITHDFVNCSAFGTSIVRDDASSQRTYELLLWNLNLLTGTRHKVLTNSYLYIRVLAFSLEV